MMRPAVLAAILSVAGANAFLAGGAAAQQGGAQAPAVAAPRSQGGATAPAADVPPSLTTTQPDTFTIVLGTAGGAAAGTLVGGTIAGAAAGALFVYWWYSRAEPPAR